MVEDFSIGFEGFAPDPDLKEFIDNLIAEIYMEAPSQSFFSVTFSKVGKIYHGIICISSAERDIMAQASDKHARAVVIDVYNQARAQIEDWKRDRFQDFVPQPFRRRKEAI